jgi:hypothetical protein
MANGTGYQDKPWLAHYGNEVPEKLEYEKTHIVAFLERSVLIAIVNWSRLFYGAS